MKYKLSQLEIPQDEPFRHDALDCQPSVEALARLIEELQGPFVLAIDSPLASVKTQPVFAVDHSLCSTRG